MTLTQPAGSAAASAHSRRWAWGISLLAHGAALAWLLHAMPPQRARVDDARPEVRFVLVRPLLAPPVPAPLPAPVAAPVPAPPAAAAAPARPAPAPRARPRTAPPIAPHPAAAPAPPIAMPEGTPEPAFTVAAPPAGSGGGFDMAAARGAARAAVSGPDGIGAGRTQVLRETRTEKLGRAIDGARNGDCQTQYAGMGILALIPLAKDTLTGSGCKWK
ncbi:hypothetical protein [uncultured Massilia sp.]|uniref:hypothetical protein n=1 Tax=uncultured Massilia sp. TaxID=169973 RepID=UPI0025D02246|nr:hypothetical protein [uncultured Massilia sp.]